MSNKGFIEILLAVAVVVIILSLLGISLGSIFGNQLLKDNFGFIWDWIKFSWQWLMSFLVNILSFVREQDFNIL